ncbi:MAG: OsmC family peroxiredoxin [Cellulomonadaceae bacterium]|nr:OsmC family peroxiredoxin [Cellulomonadaceae bacterium]
MTADNHRSVTLERLSTGAYLARNARGDELRFGSAEGAGFSPVELLLASIGGCSAVDVDIVTARRAEAEVFSVEVEADIEKTDGATRLRDILVSFRLVFPEGEGGDEARARIPRSIQRSHDSTCTVSRTIEAGEPVQMRIL